MNVPRLTKVVVNMGVGEAARDSKLIEGAVRDLTAITGQKPQVTRARKSIAQFKLREGMPIGAHVTLRGDRMWEFMDRLLSLALPRIRDFRGLSPRQFDGRGNYTFGLTEQVMFHEIDQDKVDRSRGMDITVVTTATTDDEGRALLKQLGLPLQGAVSNGQDIPQGQGGPQAEVQGARLHPLPALRPPQGRLPQVRPVPDLPARDGAPRRAARASPRAAGNDAITTRHENTDRSGPEPGARNHGERGPMTAMTMTDPIADMLTRLRNANQAYHDDVTMPYSKLKAGVAEILQQEGYITSWKVEEPAEGESAQTVGKVLELTLKYGQNRERSIAGIRRISKPGLRVYAKHTGLPKVLGGLGVAIISTSQGLLTDRQANKKGVGGEVLAYVW